MARAPRTPGVVEQPEPPVEVAPDASVTPDLPNAIDIDARAITAPVMTKQGWVCPAEQPRRLPF